MAAATHDDPGDPVLRVANALRDKGMKVRKRGENFDAQCPAHEDENASLRVSKGDKGAVLKCHAGCDTKSVVASLGLKMTDLFNDAPASKAKPTEANEPTRIYDYVDEDDNILFRVERRPGKKFVQATPNGSGWDYKVGANVRRVLYRLPGVLAQVKRGKPVFIVEGEKDVQTLESQGFVATCNPGGAGKWRPEYVDLLIGAHVIIVPDNDPVGHQHAEAIAASLLRKARSVKIVKLPHLAEHGDVTDFFVDHSHSDFVNFVRDTPVVPGSVPETFTADELMAEEFKDVVMAVPGVIAEGMTFLVGAPKIGKSWLSLGLGWSVATGEKALSTIDVEQGPVLYLALEDTPRRLQGRLNLINGGLNASSPNLHFACNWPRFPDGLARLELWLIDHPDARMVIIDTWAKVKQASANDGESMYQADYAAVSAVKHLADKYNVAIVAVHHQRKAQDADPLNTVAGSTGLTGAADATVILTRNRNNDEGTLYVTGRDVEESKSVVSFEGETGRWTWLGEAEEVEENKTQDKVKALLESANGAPLGPKEVADILEMKEGTVKWLLSKMAQEGQINKIGRGKYVALGNGDGSAAGQTPGGVTTTTIGGTAVQSLPPTKGVPVGPGSALTPEELAALAALDADFGGDEDDDDEDEE